jgi:hypothetical protein
MSGNIGKKVYQYDLKGNFINEYQHAMEAAFKLKISYTNIYLSIYGIILQCNKSIWTDKYYIKLPTDILNKALDSKWIRYDRPIYQYNKFGKFIKSYKNLKDISDKIGVQGNIRMCLIGKLKQTQDCFWSFIKFDEYPYDKISFRNSKKVIQYDLNGKEIKKWVSITEAGKSLNIRNPYISNCCRGLKKSAGGFIWKYEDIS